ncbi:MAG: RluA family pseudouridine synthase [Pseudomonadales bacterium]
MSKSDTFQVSVSKDNATAGVAALLADSSGLSNSQVKKAMNAGAVWLERDGKSSRIRRNTQLKPADQLTLNYAPELLRETPPTLKTVHKDDNFSVWIKPRGMTISGSRFCDHTSLKRCIETQLSDQPAVYIVHRLDRFTAGLIVVAHNKVTAAHLAEQFRTHQVSKHYHALVTGCCLEQATIDLPIDGKAALSLVIPVVQQEARSIVQVEIKTGRKHQVRRHLASIDHPIIGDRQYNQRDLDQSLDLQLLASKLGFSVNDEQFTFTVHWQDYLHW